MSRRKQPWRHRRQMEPLILWRLKGGVRRFGDCSGSSPGSPQSPHRALRQLEREHPRAQCLTAKVPPGSSIRSRNTASPCVRSLNELVRLGGRTRNGWPECCALEPRPDPPPKKPFPKGDPCDHDRRTSGIEFWVETWRASRLGAAASEQPARALCWKPARSWLVGPRTGHSATAVRAALTV